MRVLAGDIGGTKVLLQIAEADGRSSRIEAEARYESAQYPSFLALVEEFLRLTRTRDLHAACFGIAGPVRPTAGGEAANVTNLPWRIESETLMRELKIPRVRLINDFQAVGYGIPALGAEDFAVLQAGQREPRAPCALIGAGTGLGQGLLVWAGDYYEAIATEGGHADFAPIDELQMDLLAYLRARFGRVSYERVLSGPGLMNVYGFFLTRGEAGTPGLLESDDPPAAITAAALAGSDPAAVETLRLFVRVYGAQCGNFALSVLATGGVYVAGGIAAKILPALKTGEFLRTFSDKGRMSTLLESMPVEVVLNPRVGLIGAALAASRLT
jgi:glucokinase